MDMKPSLLSAPPSVLVFKFKFLRYAPHQNRQIICVCYGVFFEHENITYSEIYEWFVAIRSLHISSALAFLSSCSRITYHTQTHTHTHIHTYIHTHTHIHTHTIGILLEKWFPLKSERAHSLYFVIQLRPPLILCNGFACIDLNTGL